MGEALPPLKPLPDIEERVKLRKHLMQLTATEAAQEIGVDERTLRRWEKGYPLTAKNHRKYQVALQRWREATETYP
jgi:DNA-binding XRE family transcriptional regulator